MTPPDGNLSPPPPPAAAAPPAAAPFAPSVVPPPPPPPPSSSNRVLLVLAIVIGGGLVLLMVVAIIGIIAAIAIPSLLRARISANESAAIGNLRTVISAEAAYQSANGGYYDVPGCLYKPEPCLRTSSPVFLQPDLVAFDTPKNGYVLRFYPGEAAPASDFSPSSLTGFAVVAAPASPQTGVRTFCADSSGVVCTLSTGGYDAGSTASADGGVCPESCVPLR